MPLYQVDREVRGRVVSTFVNASCREEALRLARADLEDAPERTLRALQGQLVWVNEYGAAYNADPRPHKHLAHAVLHVGKAAGRLAELVDALDHGRSFPPQDAELLAYHRFVADLVICALRMGNHFPEATFDVQHAVLQRARDKGMLLMHDPARAEAQEADLVSELSARVIQLQAEAATAQVQQHQAVQVAHAQGMAEERAVIVKEIGRTVLELTSQALSTSGRGPAMECLLGARELNRLGEFVLARNEAAPKSGAEPAT